MQSALGEALRLLRKRRGLTQEQLADATGIDATYISQIERGRRGIRWFTIVRLLRATDTTLAEFAGAFDEPTASE